MARQPQDIDRFRDRLVILETQRDSVFERLKSFEEIRDDLIELQRTVQRNGDRIVLLEAKAAAIDKFQGRLLWLVLVGLAGQVLKVLGSGNISDLLQK